MSTPPPSSTVRFLGDGTQTARDVALGLANFLASAQHTLDVAIYDSGLTGDLADILRSGFTTARDNGVTIRLAFHADTSRAGVPPPSSATAGFARSLGVDTRPVGSQRNLMHHKYVVRDAQTPGAAVLTGSTNWGEDAWTHEENVILTLYGPDLAAHYLRDFEEVWAGETETSGYGAGGKAELTFDGEPMPADVWFAPAQGPLMAQAAADLITAARERVVVASPVLTSGSVLGALRTVIARGTPSARGVVDATQMAEVMQQWAANPAASWKPAAFREVADGAALVGKISTPWTPEAVHDYMHLKMIVVDDTVLTGSFNFSHSGEDNAENLLRLDSGSLAAQSVTFIDGLIRRYSAHPALP